MIFLANVEYSEIEGISKKIQSQAKAISELKKECKLICKKGNSAFIIQYKNGSQISTKNSENTILDEAINILNNAKDIEGIYVRHMIPSIKLVKILKLARKKNKKVYYEIPTYPYYGEQIKASKNKIKTIGRLTIDTIFWPFLYKYINKLVIVKSSSKVKLYSKMINITNGIDSSKIESKDYDKSTFDKIFKLVGVGTIYKYHGYDRVINAIKKCNGMIDGKKVEFHIIGASREMDNLKEMTQKLSLQENVIFHGKMKFDELNNICNQMDLGVGCIALFRRDADIDTTLKVIEYLSRGLPVLTSGTLPEIKGVQFAGIKVSNDEKELDMEEIYNEFKNFDNNELRNLSSIAKKSFDWKNIFEYIFSK